MSRGKPGVSHMEKKATLFLPLFASLVSAGFVSMQWCSASSTPTLDTKSSKFLHVLKHILMLISDILTCTMLDELSRSGSISPLLADPSDKPCEWRHDVKESLKYEDPMERQWQKMKSCLIINSVVWCTWETRQNIVQVRQERASITSEWLNEALIFVHVAWTTKKCLKWLNIYYQHRCRRCLPQTQLLRRTFRCERVVNLCSDQTLVRHENDSSCARNKNLWNLCSPFFKIQWSQVRLCSILLLVQKRPPKHAFIEKGTKTFLAATRLVTAFRRWSPRFLMSLSLRCWFYSQISNRMRVSVERHKSSCRDGIYLWTISGTTCRR